MDLTDANGDAVLDAAGNVVRIREVKASDGDWVPCDSGAGARMLVRNSEGQLQYAGQALMNQTCARGQCHASNAEGDLRTGAPAGMDFDLPLVPQVADPATGVVGPDPQVATLLNVHQRRVYDWRQRIWDQVEGGHMPPDGAGDAFRASPSLTTVSLDDSLTCTDGAALGPITEAETRWTLGAWLACGSPLVEVSDPSVTAVAAGEVGRIMPTCGGGVMPMDDVTFDELYTDVLMPECALACHFPGGAGLHVDYSTPEVAYENLVGMSATDSCGGPMVMAVPNDPENSYILHKMGDTELAAPMRCLGVMPPAGHLTNGTALMRAWIEAGAPAPGAAPGGGGSADGGI